MTEESDCEIRVGAVTTVLARMEIRPRSFGENLNEWFRAMGKTWQPLLVFCAFVYVPLGVVSTALFLIPGTYESYFGLFVPESEPQDLTEIVELIGPIILVGLVWILLLVLASALTYIVSSRALALTANGEQATGIGLLRFGLSRLATSLAAAFFLFIGLAVVAGLVTLAGWALITSLGTEFTSIFLTTVMALAAMVAIVWVAVGVSLFAQSIAMEDVGPTDALTRSFNLVRSRWWPTLGFVMLAGLIVSAVSQVISVAMLPVWFIGFAVPVFIAIAYGLATMLQGPFIAAIALAYAVWYVDLRAREGPLTTEELV